MVRWAIAVILLCGGCSFDLHPIPSNAAPSERNSVALLKPLCESISWNSEGHVQSIALVGEHVNDDHVVALSDFTQLAELQLLSWSITDDSLQTVAGLPRLTALGVQHTLVTDNGLRHLSTCPALKYIDVSGTSITDEGLASLSQIPTLFQVFAGKTGITRDAVAAFLDQRPDRRIQWDDVK